MRAGIILFALMAGLCELPQLKVDQACEEREAALDRELKVGVRKDCMPTSWNLMFGITLELIRRMWPWFECEWQLKTLAILETLQGLSNPS